MEEKEEEEKRKDDEEKAREKAAYMFLETLHALYFDHFVKEKNDNDGEEEELIGVWTYDYIPIYQNDQVHFINYLEIEVDVKKRRFVRGIMDGEEISPFDAVVIAVFTLTIYTHTITHVFSNWALDFRNDIDPKIRRMAVVSLCYNYYGFM